jgi:ABC-type antimicrobial peptide transport system permease subunit
VERMSATLAICFGALAVALAAVGLYGVVSYVVATRTREIGVRLALGAGRGAVFAMVMRDVAALLAAGVTLGVSGALAAGRYVAAGLYGVQAGDPFSILAAVTICAAVASFAGLIPALRATRIDPVRALRWE